MWRKYLIITLLLFLMIGAVSASGDIEDNLTASDNENIQETIDNEILKESGTFSGSTFTELQGKIDAANEDEHIELENDIMQDADSQITINKAVSIDGKGHSIDAGKKSAIFKVNAENVVLKNINFMNAEYDSYGSCVEWYGANGLIINCTFKNSNAEYGGAVYWENPGGSIINSTFINNTAQFGGAVALYESGIKILNCTFTNNTAGSGGAVDCSGESCEIRNCLFTDNHATLGAGAIAWYGEMGILSNSIFIKNHADMGYGAIDWSGCGAKINNCTFNANYADSIGALSISSENGCVDDSRFINNTAISEVGGAIFSEADNITFTNLLIENNTASVAGAIYWKGVKSRFENLTLTNNTAKTAPNLYINGNDAEIIDINSNDTDLLYVGEDAETVPVIKQKVEITHILTKIRNSAYINITLSKKLDLDITVSVNGLNRTVKSKNGEASLNLTGLDNGDYNITISINESGIICNPVKDSFNVNVIKTRLVADDFTTYEYSKEKLKIQLFDENGNPISNKKLTLTIGNKTYSATIGSNGTALKNINLESGNYNLIISYPGDDTYLDSKINISLIVKEKIDISTNLTKNVNNISYYITLSKNINETLIISLNGENTTVKAIDGKCQMNYNDLDYGNYTVKVLMDSKYYYNDINDKFNVSVKKSFIHADSLQFMVGDSSKISITLKDGKNNPISGKNIKISLNNETYENVTNEKGFTFIPYIFNESGSIPISITFEGDELYLKSNTLTVAVVKNKIKADISISKKYNDVTVNIALSEKINTNLKVQVNDKSYNVKVSDGKASLKLNDLKSNTYRVSLSMNDEKYDFGSDAKAASFKITSQDVALKNAAKVKLTLKKVKIKKSAKKLVLKATLKIKGKLAKNKKIKFKFNKKTYTAKTNKKGVAKVTIKKKVLKKLKVGKKIKYQAIYGKIKVSKTVKVKK